MKQVRESDQRYWSDYEDLSTNQEEDTLIWKEHHGQRTIRGLERALDDAQIRIEDIVTN